MNLASSSWAIISDPKAEEYKEQIKAEGIRFQRIGGVLLVFMLLLFFKVIFSWSDSLEKITKQLTKQQMLEQNIGKNVFQINNIKKEIFIMGQLKKYSNQEEEKNKKEEIENQNKLTGIEYDLIRLESDRDDLEMLDFEKSLEELMDRLKKLQDKSQRLISELEKMKGKKGITDNRYDEIQLVASKTQISIKKNLDTCRKEALLSQDIFLPAALLGLDENPKITLPILVMPVVWSIVLFCFLIFWTKTRISMLNLYARLIRCALTVGERNTTICNDGLEVFLDENAEEMLGMRQSGWWWLAPLPCLKGRWLEAKELRAALGWTKVYSHNKLFVTILAFVLITLQIVVLYLGVDIINKIDNVENGYSIWWHSASMWSITLVNVIFILFALIWSDRIPDFKSNKEEDVNTTRRVLLMLFAFAPFGFFGYTAKPITKLCNPRFRSRKPNRWNLADINFKQGFFQNLRSKVIHYAALTPTPWEKPNEGKTPNPAKKRNILFQKSLTEKTIQKAMICYNMEKTPTPSYKPDSGLVFRDAGNISQSELKQLSADEILDTWQKLHSKPTSKKKLTNLRLNKTRFIFAVEQYVLYELQQPNSQEIINDVCRFLFAAIQSQAQEPSADTLRLFDLLAALSVRYNQKDLLAKVQDKALEFGRESQLPAFFERFNRWKSDKWQKRWLAAANRKWSGLPM
jgi:hypothetical protein